MIHDVPGPTLQRMYEAFVASIDGIVWEGDVESRQLTFVSPEAERLQRPSAMTDVVEQDAEQQVLDAEVAVAQRARLLVGVSHHLASRRRIALEHAPIIP